MRLGAGGWITDLGIVLSDNTMWNQMDTYGGYVFNASAPSGGNAGGTGVWQPFVTKQALPASDPITDVLYRTQCIGNMGVYASAFAPSNSSVGYMLTLGYMFKTTNKGANWTNIQSGLGSHFSAIGNTAPNNHFPPGTGDSSYGPKMAIDPNNANFCWFGLTGTSAGIYYTQDGGTTWTGPISTGTLPAPTGSDYSYFFCFAHGSSSLLYVGINGVGVYCSTNANTATPTWTKISGSGTSLTGLTSFRRGFCDSTGRLWVTSDDGTTNNVYRYSGGGTGGTWTHISLAAVNNQGRYHAIAEDPTVASAQRIVLLDDLAIVTQSLDGGATWSGSNNNPTGIGTITSTDVPWIEQPHGSLSTLNSGYTIGNAAFDSNGVLWWASGVGMFKANLPNPLTASNFNWVDVSVGIEQLVAAQCCASPSGNIVGVHWDRGVVPIPLATKQYATKYYPQGLSTAPGPCIDWAGSSTFVALEAYAGTSSILVSSDGGLTFSSPGTAGPPSSVQCNSICATSALNFVSMGNLSNIAYTLDGGVTWHDQGSYFNTNFSIPSGSMACGRSTGCSDVTMAADRSTTLTAYALVNLSAANHGGVYRTQDGGATWNKQSAVDAVSGLSNTVLNLNGRVIMRSIYGLAGGLIYFNCQPNTGVHPYTAATNCMISTDGGVTWADLSVNVRDVWGCDTTITLGSFPRIWIWGWVKVAGTFTPGCYYSDDKGATWTFAVQQEMQGTLDILNWFEASKTNANEFYTSYEGSGHSRYGI